MLACADETAASVDDDTRESGNGLAPAGATFTINLLVDKKIHRGRPCDGRAYKLQDELVRG